MLDVAIRNNMKTVLQSKGWSIRQLSIALKKDYSYVHRLVTTDPVPDGTGIGSLAPVARLLDVTIDALITYEPDN